MDNSPLARLPRELRDEIYTYTLYYSRGIAIDLSGTKPRHVITTSYAENQSIYRPNLQALGQTCRQVHSESIALFYNLNTFRLLPARFGDISLRTSGTWPSSVEPWLEQIGRSNVAALEHVDIDLGVWRANSPYAYASYRSEMAGDIASYLTRFSKLNVKCTFSFDVRYSDLLALGLFRVERMDIEEEERVFPLAGRSKFQDAFLERVRVIHAASLDSRLEGHAVVRLMMGLDHCRENFSSFLDVVKAKLDEAARTTT